MGGAESSLRVFLGTDPLFNHGLFPLERQSLTEKLRNGPVRRDQKAVLSSCVWPALQGDGLIFHLSNLAVVHLGHSKSRAGYGESLSLGTPTACGRPELRSCRFDPILAA